MDAPINNPHDESVGDLLGRLVEDGRAYARAEVDLYKQIARHRTAKARNGIIALVGGGVLLWFAGIALVVGCVLALATLVGPLASGLIVAAILAVPGYFGVMYGLQGLQALSGDEEEREALRKGESR